MRGVVVKSTGSWYQIKTEDGQELACRIKGKFRLNEIKSTNPVTVGDKVVVEREEHSDTGIITDILDRKNYIIRKSVNLSKQTHIIAANIDQAFLLVTLIHPVTHTQFIDRFLGTAEAYDIPAFLVFNKIDIYNADLDREKENLIGIYQKIGYECLEVSATEKTNLHTLKNLMKGKVNLLSGHSGTGKSTLINAIAPDLNLKTAEISTQHCQGQHTTTFAEMFPLPFGGYIIDTPGIKGFGVVDFDPEETTDFFREFFARKHLCKFNNCQHVNEPKCAVKKALEDGEIAISRYQSYLEMLNEEKERFRMDAFR
ncbi:MAG: ribosome small subunit-dependent GTPase A [Flavobacteriales bacterium]|nr:MAG: ribosome small subunit-dependent GTPase A [Flavobacteriales bacterium]